MFIRNIFPTNGKIQIHDKLDALFNLGNGAVLIANIRLENVGNVFLGYCCAQKIKKINIQ
jgi:hypothetical protein